MDLRRIRQLSGTGRERAAARAGVSDAVARVYEIDPSAVSAASRARLDAVYRELHATVREQLAGLGEWPSSTAAPLRVVPPNARAVSSVPPIIGRGDPRF